MKKDLSASPYCRAYMMLEDAQKKRDFREDMCANYGWSRATFYNKLKCVNLPPKIANEFMRVINLYMQRI